MYVEIKRLCPLENYDFYPSAPVTTGRGLSLVFSEKRSKLPQRIKQISLIENLLKSVVTEIFLCFVSKCEKLKNA